MSEIKIDKAVAKKEVAEAVAAPKMVAILIHEQDGPCGSDDVFVQDGNKEWLIKRGVEVEVPEGVYNILRSAVITTYDPVKGADGEIEYKERKFPRFNMTLA